MTTSVGQGPRKTSHPPSPTLLIPSLGVTSDKFPGEEGEVSKAEERWGSVAPGLV